MLDRYEVWDKNNRNKLLYSSNYYALAFIYALWIAVINNKVIMLVDLHTNENRTFNG